MPHECVKFNKKLGEGQFGLVWKGEILARKGSRTVAIKMLHGTNVCNFLFHFFLNNTQMHF